MTDSIQGPGTAGVLLPLMVERALREVAKSQPAEGQRLRKHIEDLSTGALPGSALRIFPSVRAQVARAAVRGGVLGVGHDRSQRCTRRWCDQPSLVLLVDGMPVALFSDCEKHAGEPNPTAPSPTSSH